MSEMHVDIENYSHLLFGLIAIQEGLINNLQLLEALDVQKQTPDKKIGTILNELKYLQMRDVFSILKEQAKFREKAPGKWPYIPDTVLKGLVYFSPTQVFKNITMKDILNAQKIYKKYEQESKRKTLASILIEDLGLTTPEELKYIQGKIFFNARSCNLCLRLFSLYNYDPQIKIACPVCEGKTLSLTVDEWKKQKSQEEIVQVKFAKLLEESDIDKEGDEKEKDEKFKPRVTMALASFYQQLEKDNTPNEIKELDQPELQSLGKTRAMPAMNNINKTRVMPQSPLQKNVTKVMPQSPLQKSATKTTAQLPVQNRVKKDNKQQLKELYENLEKKEEKRQEKKAQKIIKENKKINLREGLDTVFSAKQRQGQKKVFQNALIVALIFSAIISFFLFYGSSKEEKYPILLVHEIKDDAPITKKPQNKDNKTVDIAQAIVKKKALQLRRVFSPDQEFINSVLHEIYLEREEYKNSGDFWNLIGRLYLYKIFLDRNQHLLHKQRVEKLKIEAIKALEMAKKNYIENKAEPSLELFLASWMPEKNIGLNTGEILLYKSRNDAINDVKKLLDNVQLICDLTLKY